MTDPIETKFKDKNEDKNVEIKLTKNTHFPLNIFITTIFTKTYSIELIMQ